MTRRSGQVTSRQALAGLGATALMLWLIVVGLEALLTPAERVPALDAPAEPAEATCPQPEELDGAPTPLEVSADGLVECPDAYDGRTVRYTGEVVRAVLPRGQRAWVQLNDDAYGLTVGPIPEARTALGGNSGIAVSVPIDVARQVAHVGNHSARGDVISVAGTFRRADPADDGGPAIQATSARIVDPGHPVEHPVSATRAAVALVLALLAGGATATARRARR